MARVVRRAASASARHGLSRAVQRRARKHKVILESVTQEKKKLRSVISFEAQAPPGYTFIPAGNPRLTSTCKEQCRKEGLQVYAVSTTPHIKMHDLSQHVHRIGYHFPSTVVATACAELGLYLARTGEALPLHTLGTAQNPPPADSEVSQITINTEARDAIKDLFPNIPQHDLFQIIKTAFQIGQRKVGTATELPLARRAQLAVVAHIRHMYTDYDRILRVKSFHEARSAVEQATLAKVIEWRGDDENGQTVLEDVFREVIVISDDEDSETEEEGIARPDTRGQDAQVISKDARAHEINIQPVSTAQLSRHDSLREPSEEAPPGFRIVSKIPAERASDRRGFSRYQAWNRALNRYRAEVQSNNLARLDDVSAEQRSPRYTKRPVVAQESADPVRCRDAAPRFMSTVHKAASKPILVDLTAQRSPASLAVNPLSDTNHVGAQERRHPLEGQQAYPEFRPNGLPLALTAQKPPEVRRLQGSPRSGQEDLYSQDSSRPGQRANVPFKRLPAPSQPMFIGRPNDPHLGNEIQSGRGTEVPSSSRSRPGPVPPDYVLPSVETSWPQESRPAEGHLEHLTQRMSLRSVTPARRQGDIFQHDSFGKPDSPNDHNSKRRRLAHDAAPHHDTRSEVRKAKPVGLPVSQGMSPRRHHRRGELVLEPRSQNGTYLDPRYSSAVVQPSLPGIHQEQNPLSFVPPPASDARAVIDLTHVGNSPSHVSMHHPQPGLPDVGNSNFASRRTFGAAASSRSDRPLFHGDRSPHMDRARPSVPGGPHAPHWKPVDGSHLFTGAPSGGKLYADDFVRHVDIQEVRPVQYYVQRPAPRTQRVEENSGQAMRTMVPKHYVVKKQSHASTSEQRQPPAPGRLTQPLYDQASQGPENIFEGHLIEDSIPQRHPGNEVSTSRRLRDSRPFQMLEQNRPVYVQRVESQPPPYTIPDGRHMVIVD